MTATILIGMATNGDNYWSGLDNVAIMKDSVETSYSEINLYLILWRTCTKSLKLNKTPRACRRQIPGRNGYTLGMSDQEEELDEFERGRRFEREALALQQICPEVIVRRRDFIRYFVRAVIQDIWTSKSKVLNIRYTLLIQIF